MKTKNLIAEYQANAVALEKEIATCNQAIIDFKDCKGSVYFFNEEDAVSKRKIAYIKRQLIFQFIKELEDIDLIISCFNKTKSAL